MYVYIYMCIYLCVYIYIYKKKIYIYIICLLGDMRGACQYRKKGFVAQQATRGSIDPTISYYKFVKTHTVTVCRKQTLRRQKVGGTYEAVRPMIRPLLVVAGSFAKAWVCPDFLVSVLTVLSIKSKRMTSAWDSLARPLSRIESLHFGLLVSTRCASKRRRDW